MVFSGQSNLSLAKELAKKTGLKLGEVLIEKFSDGESYVQIREQIKGKEIFVLQSLNYPASENLIELLIMIDALKGMAPQSITAILPFYAYRRQEKKSAAGESITAKLIAKLLETAGVNQVILVDIHSEKILKFFRVPAINIKVTDLFADYFRKLKLKNLLVVAPDEGAFADAKCLAKKLNLSAVFIVKKRKTHDVVASMELSEKVAEKNILMIDDEIDTGGTIIKAATLLKNRGAKDIYVACTHPILSDLAVARLKKAPIKKIFTTNTIPILPEKKLNKISIISVVPPIAEIIKKNRKR